MSSSDLPKTPTSPTKPLYSEVLQQHGDQGQDEQPGSSVEEQSGRDKEDNAPGLFYAYARRSDHPASSRYILTFSSVGVCNTWFSLLQSEFSDIEPRRESAQLFSFKGDDVPGRVWKHRKFEDIKSKWFYTQIGDAVGTNGRPQSILPVMDASGNVVGVGAAAAHDEPVPVGKNVRCAGGDDGKSRKIDFERLESSLDKITQLLETTSTKNAELEMITRDQADTIVKLTFALQQSAEQIRGLSESQQKLMEACDELRKLTKDREERCKKMSMIGSAASTMSCGHDVRRPPRKVGRKVIGYVYGDRENGIMEGSVREE